MPSKLRSQTTTKLRSRQGKSSRGLVTRRLPAKRPPTHPGEMLQEEFLKPLGISQSAFAVRLGISFLRLNEIIRGKRGVTPDTALRLAHVLGMSADFWLGLQQDWDLWHALRSEKAVAIARLEPLRHAGGDDAPR
jgi:addiction module HigA family antidote